MLHDKVSDTTEPSSSYDAILDHFEDDRSSPLLREVMYLILKNSRVLRIHCAFMRGLGKGMEIAYYLIGILPSRSAIDSLVPYFALPICQQLVLFHRPCASLGTLLTI